MGVAFLYIGVLRCWHLGFSKGETQVAWWVAHNIFVPSSMLGASPTDFFPAGSPPGLHTAIWVENFWMRYHGALKLLSEFHAPYGDPATAIELGPHIIRSIDTTTMRWTGALHYATWSGAVCNARDSKILPLRCAWTSTEHWQVKACYPLPTSVDYQLPVCCQGP